MGLIEKWHGPIFTRGEFRIAQSQQSDVSFCGNGSIQQLLNGIIQQREFQVVSSLFENPVQQTDRCYMFEQSEPTPVMIQGVVIFHFDSLQ